MLGPMLRRLLEDRFKLQVHWETKDVPAYALTVSMRGPSLQAAKSGNCVPADGEKFDPPKGRHFCGLLIRSVKPGVSPASFYGASMEDFCRGLSVMLDRPVIDHTGIAGVFDIALDLSLADLFPIMRGANQAPADSGAPPSAAEPAGTSVFEAVQKLGLKLVKTRADVNFLVIDRMMKASEN
jgi:uncharacterized protein (TIGR03435 family)